MTPIGTLGLVGSDAGLSAVLWSAAGLDTGESCEVLDDAAAQLAAYFAGDLIEFELGIFLAGTPSDALGRFNYYSDVTVYKVGSPGARPWFRGPSRK